MSFVKFFIVLTFVTIYFFENFHCVKFSYLYDTVLGSIEDPEGAKMMRRIAENGSFPKIRLGKKVVELSFGDQFGVPIDVAAEPNTLRTIYNEITTSNILPTLIYEGHLFFVNCSVSKVLEEIKGFQTSVFVLYTDCKELPKYFEEFLKNQVKILLGICVENDTLKFYSIKAFDRNNCNSAKINLVGTWNETHSTLPSRFPRKRSFLLMDMQGCWLNASFVDKPPTVLRNPTPDGGKGWEVDLLSQLLKRIDGVVKYNVLNEKFNSFSDLREELNKGIDLIGGMVYSPYLRADERTINCGLTTKLIWVTPKRKKFEFTDLTSAVFAVPVELMLMMFLVYAIVTFFFFIISSLEAKLNHPKWTGFCIIFFLILNQPVKVPNSCPQSMRMQFIVWSFFAVVISICYQAVLKSKMTVGKPEIFIGSFDDLMSLDLKIVSRASDYFSHLESYVGLKKKYSNLHNRLICLRDDANIQKILEKMAHQRNFAFLENQETVEHHMLNMDKDVRKNLKIQYSFTERILTPFIVKKTSLFGNFFRRTCVSVIEAGIVSKLRARYRWKAKLWKKPKSTETIRPLALFNVSYPFFLYVIGIYFSVWAFMMEHLYFCLKSKKVIAQIEVLALVVFLPIIFTAFWFTLIMSNWKPAPIFSDKQILFNISSVNYSNGVFVNV